MTETPEGSIESVFIEKPGIEPAAPGLQGIALIHYTTGGFSNHHIILDAVLDGMAEAHSVLHIVFYLFILLIHYFERVSQLAHKLFYLAALYKYLYTYIQ